MSYQIIIETTNGDVVESRWTNEDEEEVSIESVQSVITMVMMKAPDEGGSFAIEVDGGEWTCLPRSSIYAITIKTRED